MCKLALSNSARNGPALRCREVWPAATRSGSAELLPQRGGKSITQPALDTQSIPDFAPLHLTFPSPQEDSFHLVDNKPEKRNKGGRRFQPNRFQQQRQREQERRAEQEKDARGQRKQQRKQQQQYQNYRESQRVRATCLTPRE